MMEKAFNDKGYFMNWVLRRRSEKRHFTFFYSPVASVMKSLGTQQNLLPSVGVIDLLILPWE